MKMTIKGNMLLIAFIISTFWLYINSKPGTIVTGLDLIYIIFGYLLPYIIIISLLRYEKDKKKI